ncbi:MAG TPA: orotidine-5'-phosphate decarboxylase [Solirubrobacteraceae bacterium]|nr:orotidine-5'-phosphate decarboxylase [Solirubrobacteraceae bacterium]
MAPTAFADRLVALVTRRESQIVLGLDPDPLSLWAVAGPAFGADGTPATRTARAVSAHCLALIAAAGPACVAVKPQLACFERLGAPGIAALDDVISAAHEAGLMVIADGKRGDVPVSAAAYAQALAGATPGPAGEVRGLGADAFTANPLLGIDALEPLIATRAGVFVLVRTSNPGAADLQDLELATGELLWERIARIVHDLGVARDCGLADVGAVFGATAPEHLARARELMPQAIFLLPGVGAQGGRVEDLAAAFAPGPAAGLVTASRSIAQAHAANGGGPAEAARAEAERLREIAWSLG